MSKARRLAHERRKETWNIWRIKSPWLRLPTAWVLVLIYAIAVIVIVAIAIPIGAWVGAREYVTDAIRGVNLPQAWNAMTKWRST